MELDFNQLTTYTSGKALENLLSCNDVLERYGLVLTPEDGRFLTERRNDALQATGRIEFGNPILSKLALTFGSSPSVNQENFRETLGELLDLFYYYKGEALEQLTDDQLIHYMKVYYDGPCHGDLELLQSRELDHLARSIRYGVSLSEEDEEGEKDDD